MDDDIDIYEDLQIFDTEKNENESYKILQGKFRELEIRVNEYTKKIESLEKVNQALEVNISSLWKTAKAEIARKDKMISNLRKELDDIAFKRNQRMNPHVGARTFENKKTSQVNVVPNIPRQPMLVANQSFAFVPIETINVHESAKEEKGKDREVTQIKAAEIVDEEEDEDEWEQRYVPEKRVDTIYSQRLRRKLMEEEIAEREQKEQSKKAESKENVIKNTELIGNTNAKENKNVDKVEKVADVIDKSNSKDTQKKEENGSKLEAIESLTMIKPAEDRNLKKVETKVRPNGSSESFKDASDVSENKFRINSESRKRKSPADCENTEKRLKIADKNEFLEGFCDVYEKDRRKHGDKRRRDNDLPNSDVYDGDRRNQEDKKSSDKRLKDISEVPLIDIRHKVHSRRIDSDRNSARLHERREGDRKRSRSKERDDRKYGGEENRRSARHHREDDLRNRLRRRSDRKDSDGRRNTERKHNDENSYRHDERRRDKRRMDDRKEDVNENKGKSCKHSEVSISKWKEVEVKDRKARLESLENSKDPKAEKVESKDAKAESKDSKVESKDARMESKNTLMESKDVKVDSKELKVDSKELKVDSKDTKMESKDIKMESKEVKVGSKDVKNESKEVKKKETEEEKKTGEDNAEDKDNGKNHEMDTSGLEEGEILDTPESSPCKISAGNKAKVSKQLESLDPLISESYTEEKIENIEKFIETYETDKEGSVKMKIESNDLNTTKNVEETLTSNVETSVAREKDTNENEIEKKKSVVSENANVTPVASKKSEQESSSNIENDHSSENNSANVTIDEKSTTKTNPKVPSEDLGSEKMEVSIPKIKKNDEGGLEIQNPAEMSNDDVVKETNELPKVPKRIDTKTKELTDTSPRFKRKQVESKSGNESCKTRRTRQNSSLERNELTVSEMNGNVEKSQKLGSNEKPLKSELEGKKNDEVTPKPKETLAITRKDKEQGVKENKIDSKKRNSKVFIISKRKKPVQLANSSGPLVLSTMSLNLKLNSSLPFLKSTSTPPLASPKRRVMRSS